MAGRGGASIVAAAIACTCACAAGALLLAPIDAVFGGMLAISCIVIAVVDLDRFEIPDVASLAMFALGMIWTQTFGMDLQALAQALLRSLVVAGVLLAVRIGYRVVRKMEGLGLGDVKLAGAGAAWLAYPQIAIAFLIAVGAAVAVIAVRSVVVGEPIKAHAAVPFGTFLAPAVWLAWFMQIAGVYRPEVGADQWLWLLASGPFQ